MAALAQPAAADGLDRRTALDQALAGMGIVVEWGNEALAQEQVLTRSAGRPDEALRAVLAGTSYVLVHGRDAAIKRIIVTGAATGAAPATVPRLAPRAEAASATPAPDVTTPASDKKAEVRERVLKRMQEESEALRRRMAERTSGTRLLRSQAVRVSPADNPGQGGNIPLLSSFRDIE